MPAIVDDVVLVCATAQEVRNVSMETLDVFIAKIDHRF